MQNPFHRRVPKLSKRRRAIGLATILGCLVLAIAPNSAVAKTSTASVYRTAAWGDKFIYGAYSTLVSSYVLGVKHHDLVVDLSSPEATLSALSAAAQRVKQEYDALNDSTVADVIRTASAPETTDSIYEPARSAVRSVTQNDAFVTAMPRTKGSLAPVDDMLQPDGFKSTAVQYNAHRGAYNNAFSIPQNSAAAALNAYIAGIRSVEFDVLETKDDVNVVIHDLVTNRLDASFNAPPKDVRKWDAKYLSNIPINVLNPLGSSAAAESTGVKGLMTTERYLNVVNATTHDMTLYADARNSAPVSLTKLLASHPNLGRNLVIKVYPFELTRGLVDVLEQYGDRYEKDKATKEAKIAAAGREIASVARPNLLLALGGAPNEVTEGVVLSSSFGIGTTDFSWSRYEALTRGLLPFSPSGSQLYRKFDGVNIFTADELKLIDAKTYLFARWVMDFSAVGNVRILQTALLPMLRNIIIRHDVAEFNAMPKKERMITAVTEDFMALYRLVVSRQIAIHLKVPDGHIIALADAWRRAGFGTSDRYPDFALARRTPAGSVDQNTLRDFLYSMNGTVYRKEDYAAKKMRSAKAIMDYITEVRAAGLPFRYITTDLPTDLRAGAMGLFGTAWPSEMRYRPSGIIKARHTPQNPDDFSPQTWSTRLFGDVRRQGEAAFESDLKRIVDAIARRDKTNAALAALNAFERQPQVLINGQTLKALGVTEPVLSTPLPESRYRAAETSLKADRDSDEAFLATQTSEFACKYGVNFDGTPVRRVRSHAKVADACPPVVPATLSSADWDQ